MAKIKFGAVVVDGRGKLGGHVFSKNRGGAYLRTKVTPVNPQSVPQSEVRSAFGSTSQAWSGLTEAERDSFNNAVESFQTTDIFGDLKKPSGKALFQKLNNNLLNVGQAMLTVAPSPGAVVNVEGLLVSAVVTGQVVELSYTNNTTGMFLVIESTGPVSSGTSNAKNKFRKIATNVGGNAQILDIATAYTSRFGALVLGQKIFFRVKAVNASGQASPAVQFIAIVEA